MYFCVYILIVVFVVYVSVLQPHVTQFVHIVYNEHGSQNVHRETITTTTTFYRPSEMAVIARA